MNIGQAQVDFEALLIESAAGRFSMESKVMDVLAVLVENPNTVMTREALIDQVWGVEHGGDERLSRAISILRKALGDIRGQHSHIETIPRKGYRLIAELDSEIDPQYTLQATENADVPPTKTKHPIEPLPHPVNSEPSKPAPHKKRKRFGLRSIAITGFLVAMAIALITHFLGPPVQNMSRSHRMESGLEHVKNFTLDNAIPQAQTLFSSILANEPEHAAAQAGMALALIREYTYIERDPALLHKAKSKAEMALKLDQHLALANIAYGWAVEYEGDYEQALKLYDRADILDPDNIFVLEARTRVYQKQDMHQETREVLQKAIALYPEHVLFYSYLGYQWFKEDEYARAEATFRQAISISNDNPRLYAQLAATLKAQNRTTEAIQVVQDGLKVRETGALYNNLGDYLYSQGQFEMAAQAFESALEKGNSHDYLIWANLASAYSFIPSRKPEAGAAFERALQLVQARIDKGGKKTEILYLRAAYYNAKLGRAVLAKEFLAQVDFDGVTSANVYTRACSVYEIIGEREMALTMLEKIVESGHSLKGIQENPDLTNLRQDPKYHLMLTRLSLDQESEQ